MDKARAEKFQALIDMLEKADSLQQELLWEIDETACLDMHLSLLDICTDVEQFAADEEEAADA